MKSVLMNYIIVIRPLKRNVLLNYIHNNTYKMAVLYSKLLNNIYLVIINVLYSTDLIKKYEC